MTATAATLTDRYLHALGRAVPAGQRDAVVAEVRERIADSIDARIADGVAQEVVEQVVLTELGDPDRLAAAYLDRPLQLIGPKFYLTWWRLLKLLLAIVLPCVAGGIAIAFAIRGDSIGEIIGGVWSITLTTAVHLAFWTTLVFAVLDRASRGEWVGGRRLSAQETAELSDLGDPWTVDRLPVIESPETRLSRAGVIATSAMGAVFIAFLIAQQFNPFLRDAAGAPVPLLEPGLWSWLLPYLIVVTAIDIAINVGVYLQGRYNWWSAIAHAAVSLAFTIPALWVWSTGDLVNPRFLEIFPDGAGADWMRITGIVVGIVWAGVVAWDLVDQFRRAERGRVA
ncbi:MAG TPA: hypothetical protein VNQ48_08335 [Microbacteriaceae bacterium]|nr:hypothetical protein [Microbacteriaceae bacterium]